MSEYACPACGAEMPGPDTLCSGSFLDADHPANVKPVLVGEGACPLHEEPDEACPACGDPS